jgi:hypothetical protein
MPVALLLAPPEYVGRDGPMETGCGGGLGKNFGIGIFVVEISP